jgi:hypothetical protein
MLMLRRALVPMAAVVAAAMALGSCGTAQQPSPRQLLQAAARNMATLTSVQLDLKFGPGFQVQGVELVSAVGKFRAPTDSDFVAKTRGAEGFIEPEILTVGDQVYIKYVQFQAFQQLTAIEAQQYPVIARMLDKNSGLAPATARGRDPRIAGSEQLDGVDCYKVSALYGPAELQQALAPLTLKGDVRAVLWIGKSDQLVHKLRFDGPLVSAGTDSFAEVHLHDFNAPVTIPSPG